MTAKGICLLFCMALVLITGCVKVETKVVPTSITNIQLTQVPEIKNAPLPVATAQLPKIELHETPIFAQPVFPEKTLFCQSGYYICTLGCCAIDFNKLGK